MASSWRSTSVSRNEFRPPRRRCSPVNDDAELLARIRGGAPDEFGELVRRHQARVFAILHRYERDFHKVEDLAQETFLRTWRFLDRFDGRAPFEHWLSRIALRVALDHLRRQKRVRAEVALADLGEDALDWLRHPEADAAPNARQAAELLDTALRELAPEDRQVIVLLELEGRSVKEICALTGFSNAAVRVRAFRARARLRKILVRLEKRQHE
jgi:RNA polymerase sigma-70 factor, ECF subfamily